MKEIKYRVFDSKGRYQQSYSAQLDGAYQWAVDCAKYSGGYIMEVLYEGGKEQSSSKIYPK